MENKTRDKTGREIMIGDVLKVYHYTAALRREKVYMYKHVVGLKTLGGAKLKDGGQIPYVDYFEISHLSIPEECNYYIGMNEGVLGDYEIVQGWPYHKERPRVLTQ